MNIYHLALFVKALVPVTSATLFEEVSKTFKASVPFVKSQSARMDAVRYHMLRITGVAACVGPGSKNSRLTAFCYEVWRMGGGSCCLSANVRLARTCRRCT